MIPELALGITTEIMVPRPGGAQRERGFAQFAGHESQHLLGRADHQRQHDQSEGDSSGDAGEPEEHHPHRIDQRAGDDRWHADQDVGEKACHPGQLASVFHQIYRCRDADGHRQRRRNAGDDEASDDAVQESATGLAGIARRRLGKELRAQVLQPLSSDVDEHPGQHGDCGDHDQ